jgi:hyperosmotically inducible protein
MRNPVIHNLAERWYSMSNIKKWIFILVALTFMLGATGCSQDGPAEKAGKKVDEAADSAKKKIKKLMD